MHTDLSLLVLLPSCRVADGGASRRRGIAAIGMGKLEAKVRSQESWIRSLRADVTMLRQRLRVQAETLGQQREQSEALSLAAEQVRGRAYCYRRLTL